MKYFFTFDKKNDKEIRMTIFLDINGKIKVCGADLYPFFECSADIPKDKQDVHSIIEEARQFINMYKNDLERLRDDNWNEDIEEKYKYMWFDGQSGFEVFGQFYILKKNSIYLMKDGCGLDFKENLKTTTITKYYDDIIKAGLNIDNYYSGEVILSSEDIGDFINLFADILSQLEPTIQKILENN